MALPTTASHSEIMEMTYHPEFYEEVVMPLGNAPGRYTPNNGVFDFGNWDFWFIWDNATLIFTVIGLIWFIYYWAVMIVASVDDDQGRYQYKTAIIAGAWNPAIWTIFNFLYFVFGIAKIGLALWSTELFAPHDDSVMGEEWGQFRMYRFDPTQRLIVQIEGWVEIGKVVLVFLNFIIFPFLNDVQY